MDKEHAPVLELTNGEEISICFNCAMHNTDAELIQMLEEV